jgi:hypothetical protein
MSPTAFNEHLQNPKWLLSKKGFVVVADCSRRVERARMEVDLEGSEPDTTYTLILNWHLELWTEARRRAEPPSKKANHARASSRMTRPSVRILESAGVARVPE